MFYLFSTVTGWDASKVTTSCISYKTIWHRLCKTQRKRNYLKHSYTEKQFKQIMPFYTLHHTVTVMSELITRIILPPITEIWDWLDNWTDRYINANKMLHQIKQTDIDFFLRSCPVPTILLLALIWPTHATAPSKKYIIKHWLWFCDLWFC